MLYNGAEVIRLQSRKMQGCGTFWSCEKILTGFFSDKVFERRRNWFAFYCKDHIWAKSFVSDCFSSPSFRCFSSFESAWTLNAVMVKRSEMLNKQYPVDNGTSNKSIAQIGLENFDKQDGFEDAMLWKYTWQKWKIPICISYNGLFLHQEIDSAE